MALKDWKPEPFYNCLSDGRSIGEIELSLIKLRGEILYL